MRKWNYCSSLIGIAALLALLSMSCKKTKFAEKEKSGELDKWCHFVLQINTESLDLNRSEERDVLDRWAGQSIDILTNRLKVFKYRSYVTRDSVKKDLLVVKTPYINDEHKDNIKILFWKGLIEWKLIIAGPFPHREALSAAYGGNIPDNSQIVAGPGCFLVSREAIISNEDIKDTSVTTDSFGYSAISITLNAEGGEKMLRFTSENIGKKLAVVIDRTGVLVVFGIEEKIAAKGDLHGNFGPDEALVYSSILKWPALPAPVQMIEEKIEEGSQKR